MGTSDAEAKKQAAINKLSALTKGSLTPGQVDHLIESAVFLLNQQFKTAVADTPTQAKIGLAISPTPAPVSTAEQL